MLKTVSAVSGLYDVVVGAVLLLGTSWMAATFGVDPPVPVIHAKLNAIFLICIGIGYALPWQDPVRYRAYLWVMGPLLKGAGDRLTKGGMDPELQKAAETRRMKADARRRVVDMCTALKHFWLNFNQPPPAPRELDRGP